MTTTDDLPATPDESDGQCQHGVELHLVCDVCEEEVFTAEGLALLDGGEPAPDDTPDEDDDTPGPVYQAADLGEFEGRKVGAVANRLAATDVDIARALHHGDTVLLFVQAKVADVGFRADGTLTRTQKLVADTILEVVDRDWGDETLTRLRRAKLRTDDAAQGRTAMGIKTTADGVVLTPGDLGDDGPLPLPPDDGEVVVVFADGERALWPDEFAVDIVERPGVGDRLSIADEDVERTVVQLLDPVRGDVIAEADPVDEARQDREAAEQLEAARTGEVAEFYDEVAKILDGTLGVVQARVKACDDWDVIDAALTAERDGKNRTGAVKFLTERLAELTAAEPF